jgi:hypothetical protein
MQKSFIIERLDTYIANTEDDLGVSTQMNCIYAREVLERVMNLTVRQLSKIENAVTLAEVYDPAMDKFDFGAVKINACDAIAFLDK